MPKETYQFTDKGLVLAILKMAMQNNAMLKSVINSQAVIILKLIELQGGEQVTDSLRDRMTEEWRTLLTKYANLQEDNSLKEAYEFAVENDANLDFDLGIPKED